jgi:rhamnosyltransferase
MNQPETSDQTSQSVPWNFDTVIVLFGPQPTQREDQLLATPGERIFVVANGIEAVEWVTSKADQLQTCCTVVLQPTNPGLAVAFNAVMPQVEAEWLLLLDQDSLPIPSGLRTLEALAVHAPDSVAVVTGVVVQQALGRSTSGDGFGEVGSPPINRSPAFQNSGTLLRVDAVEQVGGFWEALFLDLVDAELAVRLRRGGWSQLHVGVESIEHQLGSISTRRIFGRTFYPTGHSVGRRHELGYAFAMVLRRHGAFRPDVRWIIRNVAGAFLSSVIGEPGGLRAGAAMGAGFVKGLSRRGLPRSA